MIAPASRKPLSFPDTLDYDYVALYTGSVIDLQLQNAAGEARRGVRFSIQANSCDAPCLMVDSGPGIGMLPLCLRAIFLNEPWALRELKICVRSCDALPIKAKLLVNHLKRQ